MLYSCNKIPYSSESKLCLQAPTWINLRNKLLSENSKIYSDAHGVKVTIIYPLVFIWNKVCSEMFYLKLWNCTTIIHLDETYQSPMPVPNAEMTSYDQMFHKWSSPRGVSWWFFYSIVIKAPSSLGLCSYECVCILVMENKKLNISWASKT